MARRWQPFRCALRVTIMTPAARSMLPQLHTHIVAVYPADVFSWLGMDVSRCQNGHFSLLPAVVTQAYVSIRFI